ncbi:MAG: hypothetical protein IKV48_01435 [Eggerthellaceae bacterium]|nr:hypothetical protein [Eggerthellaceae bacterium]
MDNTTIGETNLALIKSEHQAIRALAEAYEKGDFSTEPEGEGVEKLKDTLWTMDAADIRPIVDALKAEMDLLDETVDWVEGISSDIETRYQACMIDKKQTEIDFTSLRKKTNGSNLSRGIWPIYGGVIVGLMMAFLARQFALGLIPCIAGGAAGYFIGNQLIQRALKMIGHPSTNAKENVEERAQLDQLRGRHEELSREHEHLTTAQYYLHRLVNLAEDLQFSISEALHEVQE